MLAKVRAATASTEGGRHTTGALGAADGEPKSAGEEHTESYAHNAVSTWRNRLLAPLARC
jgi:hypothetical protein